ncbi:bromodomain-containing protein [Rhizophagus clarus]|uniref:Bromodomain-containing protein n=1 Tax=Rhizophagus clarus TaxID=94130 RepID=A0A8H3LKU7_9GLOM|nr:bromodomain-containing protein [Rhizophagus clarus]
MNAATENNIMTGNYIGYEALVSYLNDSKNNWTYKGFLNLNQDVITASLPSLTNSLLTSIKWKTFDITWYKRFLNAAKELLEPNTFAELKKKVNTEHLRYPNKLQAYWEGVIKESAEKENLVSTVTSTVTSLPKQQTQNTNAKDFSKTIKLDHSKISQPVFTKTSHSDFSKKNINFCYDILDELTNTSYAHSFFKYIEKNNKIIKYPMDLFIINSKLENEKYTRLEEFEEDIHKQEN